MRHPEDEATYWLVVARDTDYDGVPRCIRCNSAADDVHEILPKSSFSKHHKKELFSIKNRCCVCRTCHLEVQNDRGRGELLAKLYKIYGYDYKGQARCLLEEYQASQLLHMTRCKTQ